MKNSFYLLGVFCLLCLQVNAQKVPNGIPFQGIAKDYVGAPVNERKIFIQTTLIAGSINGKPVYKEEHETTTDPLGIFSIMIGLGNKTTGNIQSLSDIKWEEGPFYLNVQLAISPNAPIQNWNYQANWMDMGTTALGIVPYAFYAVQTSGLQNKLNSTDTANMLRNYLRAGSVQANSSSITSPASNTFSGAYNDLTGKPTLFNGDYNLLNNKPALFSGAYNDLTGKPTLFSGSYLDLINTPNLFTGAYNDLSGKPVLFDGDYTSLSNLPNLFDGDYNSLGNRPVLFSGDYNALSNKPTLSLTGDITSVGSATTLSISGVASGTYGSALAIPTITVDEKGRITSATSTSITPNNFPNKTNAEKDAMSASTATGTVIWCSNCGTRGQLQVYNGTEWTDLTGGTALSSGIVFTTLSLSSITSTSAFSAVGISSDGGASITAKGLVWSTSVNPTIALTTKTNDGTGTGAFSNSITALNTSTIYYVRAYATNANGTVYGAQQSFTTRGAVPTLSTTSANSISLTGASTGGNISSDGGTNITSRGVCWSTSSNPTVSDNKLVNGNGTGSFTINLTGLNGSTTYYLRAYATNAVGTGYGPQISFTTSSLTTGVSYLGGKIAYIFQAGDAGYVAGQTHGFIIMNHTMGMLAKFADGSGYVNTSMNFGTGMNNTRLLYNYVTTGLNAAKYIYNVMYDGYNDWYIPSYSEWNKISLGWSSLGLPDAIYNCSSEISNYNSAFAQFYNNGTSYSLSNGGKTSTYNVIGIRNF